MKWISTDYFGSDSLTYQAVDSFEATSNTSTIYITIDSVNDAPELSAIDAQSIDEGGSFTYELAASDVDGDDLSYSAVSSDEVTVSVDGTDLSITPIDSNWYGSVEVEVTVSDGDIADTIKIPKPVITNIAGLIKDQKAMHDLMTKMEGVIGNADLTTVLAQSPGP